jgi:hypothetical protein
MSPFYRRGSILERRLCVHLDGASALAVSGSEASIFAVPAEPPQIPGRGPPCQTKIRPHLLLGNLTRIL